MRNCHRNEQLTKEFIRDEFHVVALKEVDITIAEESSWR